MADPNASHRDHRSPEEAAPAPENTSAPDVVDAEVVDDSSASAKPGGPGDPQDEEAFRQYQQFLEFQKFQEWQRQHGEHATAGGPGAPPSTPGKKPWWQRLLGLLRFKFVRRLLYLFVLLLLLYTAINSYFGGGDSDQAGNVGSHQEHLQTNPIRQNDPKKAVRTLYDAVATEPHTLCEKFAPEGRAAFAANYGATDCAAAVDKLIPQITNPALFKNPKFGEEAVQVVGPEAVARSCAITVEGGPKLGDFKLRREPSGGWVIVGHANEPPNCNR